VDAGDGRRLRVSARSGVWGFWRGVTALGLLERRSRREQGSKQRSRPGCQVAKRRGRGSLDDDKSGEIEGRACSETTYFSLSRCI
jgi:hypothetical protein